MSFDLLQHFSDEFITASIERGQAGAYVAGDWVSSYAAPVPFVCIAPQPLTANETQMLPSGEHVRNFVKIWTDEDINTREGDTNADRVTIDTKIYKTFQVDDRSVLGGYKKVTLREIKSNE